MVFNAAGKLLLFVVDGFFCFQATFVKLVAPNDIFTRVGGYRYLLDDAVCSRIFKKIFGQKALGFAVETNNVRKAVVVIIVVIHRFLLF